MFCKGFPYRVFFTIYVFLSLNGSDNFKFLVFHWRQRVAIDGHLCPLCSCTCPVATFTTSASIPSLTGLHPEQALQGERDLVMVIKVISCYLSACLVWTAGRV